MSPSSKACVGIACGLAWLAAGAEPLAVPDARDQINLPAASPAEAPVDVHAWIQRESSHALLEVVVEADRQEVLRQGWLRRAPTWIQDSALMVNLGDFPELDDSARRAERDLKTLEWVLEEQRKQAPGARDRDTLDPDAAPADRWLTRLLPTRWIAALKANREWVAAGGTALLAVVWGATVFMGRPAATPQWQRAGEPMPTKSGHRHRRRHRRGRSQAG